MFTPHTSHVSRVTCHVSCVMCHVSCVMCHMSRVTCYFFFFFSSFFGQSGEAYQWRVCYLRGLPRLFFHYTSLPRHRLLNSLVLQTCWSRDHPCLPGLDILGDIKEGKPPTRWLAAMSGNLNCHILTSLLAKCQVVRNVYN